MSDPFAVFGLPPESSEAEVRRRYLQLVREHPPDRAPQRFAEIHAAYEQLRNPVVRVEAKLDLIESAGSLADLIADVRGRLRATRIPTQTLLALAEER